MLMSPEYFCDRIDAVTPTSLVIVGLKAAGLRISLVPASSQVFEVVRAASWMISQTRCCSLSLSTKGRTSGLVWLTTKWLTPYSRVTRLIGKSPLNEPSTHCLVGRYGCLTPLTFLATRVTGGYSPGTAQDASTASRTITLGDVMAFSSREV